MKKSTALYFSLLLLIAGGLFYTSRPVVAPASLQTKSNAPDSTTDPADKTADKEEWERYLKKEIPLEQLSAANRKRAVRKMDLEWQAQDQARREKQQSIDAANGRNSEVREKEAELRRKSDFLYAGMTQERALEILGNPTKVGQSRDRTFLDHLKKGTTNSVLPPEEFKGPDGSYSITKWQENQTLEKLPVIGPQGVDTLFLYSPHPTGKDYYNLGDSFQCLRLWFDNSKGNLIAWSWATPMVSR